MDNAAAHKSREMKEYIKSTNGSVVQWVLPPRTPQQNPIEIQWQEIKRVLADKFFSGFDKLQERIIAIMESDEVARTKLFGYMRDAMEGQNDSEEVATVTL